MQSLLLYHFTLISLGFAKHTIMVYEQHLMDWRTSPSGDSVFYMINSQQCSFVITEGSNGHVSLNVIWGLLFLVLGICKLSMRGASGLYNASYNATAVPFKGYTTRCTTHCTTRCTTSKWGLTVNY